MGGYANFFVAVHHVIFNFDRKEADKIFLRGVYIIVKLKLKQTLRLKYVLLSIFVPLIAAFVLVNSVYAPSGARKIPIAFTDEDKSEFSKTILESMEKNKALNIVVTDAQTAEKMVSSNNIEAAFIIEKGFEKEVKTGNFSKTIKLIKNPRSISAEMIGEGASSSAVKLLCASAAADKIIAEYSKITNMSPKAAEKIWNEAWKYNELIWNKPEPIMKVDITEIKGASLDNENQNSYDRILIGVILAFLMFFLLREGWWFLEEKRNGTILRLKSSALSPLAQTIGNVLFLYLVGLIQLIIYTTVFRLILGFELHRIVILFIVISCYIFFISSVVLVISEYLEPMGLGFFVPVFSLLTSVFGGCFWGLRLLDKKVQMLSLFTPQGWALKALDNMTHQSELNLISSGFVVLALIFSWISYMRLKTNDMIL